jgi:PAS domain S-box-containing protein
MEPISQPLSSFDRRLAALEKESAGLRMLAANATDFIARHAPDGTFLFVSPSCESLLGYDPSELVGQCFFQYIHPDDIDKLNTAIQDNFSADSSIVVSFRAQKKNKDYVWLEATTKAIVDDDTGQIVETISVSRNISRRIAVEKALEDYRNDLELQVKERTEEMEQLNEELRSANEELMATNEDLNNLNAELENSNKELNRYKDHLEELVQIRTSELLRQQEVVKCIEDSISATFGEKFFENIVLNLAQALGADYVFVGKSTDDTLSSISTIAFCEGHQIIPNISYHLQGTPCAKVFGNEFCYYSSGVSQLFPEDVALHDMEISGYAGIPLFSSKHQAVGIMVALFRDSVNDMESTKRILPIFAGRVGVEIERRGIEISLKQSSDRYKLLFDNMTNGFALHEIICNEQGEPANYRYLEANPAFGQLTGLDIDNIVGKTVLDLIPNLEKEWIETFGQVALTGIPHRQENFVSQLNRYYDVLAFSPQKNRFATIFTDVTERRQFEGKRMEVVIETEEKERAKFAANLHDEVGPILSSLNIYISSLADSDDKNKKAYIIPQMQKLIRESIGAVREISNDLSPHVLTSHGLRKAIQVFLQSQNDILPVTFQSNLSNRRFPQNIEVGLYRIVKELLHNTIKHSRATEAWVTLELENEILKLNYIDNGIGFDAGMQLHNLSGGMGLMNIISRVKAINAQYSVNTRPGDGFRFGLSCVIT